GDLTKLVENLPPLPKLELPKEPIDQDKLPDIVKPEKSEDGVIDYTEAMARLQGVEKATTEKWLDNLRDKGKGGDGSAGGKGRGVGAGTGDARGSGDKKAMDERVKRMLRWNLVFDTRNGEDYRVQLQALGAILAIPTGPEQYVVLRDLKPGTRPAQEDL